MRITARFILLALLLCGLSVSSFAQALNHQPSPRVVAQISRTGQTSSIPQRILFTPQADGLFRMSVYFVVTTNHFPNNAEILRVSYTDNAGPEKQQFAFTSLESVGCDSSYTPEAPCSRTFLLMAKAGTPIMWEMDKCDCFDVTYDVFVTLEKLQPLQ
jgi:hypothetical protein